MDKLTQDDPCVARRPDSPRFASILLIVIHDERLQVAEGDCL